MNEEIRQEFEKTSKCLFETLSKFNQEQFNVQPFKGSWTAGQVSEHLLKSDVSDLLYGNVEQANRQPDEKVNQIKDTFLNFDLKMKNPDFNTPSATRHNLDYTLKSFKNIFEKVDKALSTKDLTTLCLDFELPQMGKLTGLEWMYFMAYHYQRHTHQMNNIFEKVNSA